MPSQKSIDEKMAEIRKLHAQFFEKIKQFETDRNLKWENNILLSSLLEQHLQTENLRMVMASFYWNYKSFFIAR
jgi:hypothetical protein